MKSFLPFLLLGALAAESSVAQTPQADPMGQPATTVSTPQDKPGHRVKAGHKTLGVVHKKPRADKPEGPRTVPPAVRVAFSQRFPNAMDTRWDRKRGDYKAVFKLEGVRATALYDVQGHLKETERVTPNKELPAAARGYLVQNFPKRKLKRVSRVEDAQGGITWKADIDGQDVLFDNTGHFLKLKTRERDKQVAAAR